MHNFKELKVWSNAIKLATAIYNMTRTFPAEEKFGLVSQFQRSSVSIPSNIAEGAGRNTNGEFRQFLGIAKGSLYELETLLIISKEVSFISETNYNDLTEKIEEISKMLTGLKKSIE